MFVFAVILTTVLALLAILQIVFGEMLRRHLSAKPVSCPPSYSPKVAILLSLRGSDPFLADGIRALLDQDYPDFQINIVVDSEEDPCWRVLKQFDLEKEDSRLNVQVLRNRLTTCSLKCSSMAQAVESLEEDVEVVILTDADVVSHSLWLRDAVGPLANPKVGVVSGNQWFAPKRQTAGSLIRSIWHSGSIAPTVLYGHPWAGTCAMRVKDIKRSGLVERWKKTIVDDGPINELFGPLGLETYISPALIMINREECSLSYSLTYVHRMLTWSRVYEDAFWLTLVHMFLTTFPLFAAPIVAVVAFSMSAYWAAAILLSGFLIYVVSTIVSSYLIRLAVQNAVGNQKQDLPMPSIAGWALFTVTFPIVQLVHAFSTVFALFTVQISWRKVSYEIRGRWNVKVLEDRPYPQSVGEADQIRSV